MKALRVVVVTCAVLAATASVAHAHLILVGGSVDASFTDLGAQGFGNAPRMLTTQGSGNQDILTGSGTPVDVANGDATPGANKTTTPTLASLGWTSGANVGIGFNSDQTGQSGITMRDLVLTIYDGTTVKGTFSLDPSLSPLLFSGAELARQPGNGNSVFAFKLDAAEQVQFNSIVALSGSSAFYAGLQTTLGCPSTGAEPGCQPTNDGPDSFVGFNLGTTSVPDGGSTMTLLGSALLAVGMLRRRLRA